MRIFNYDYGQTVRVRECSSNSIPSNSLASIVAMTEISTEEQSIRYGYPIGTHIYLIEFSDGSSIEVPEHNIDKV